jgi:hypothetical protein
MKKKLDIASISNELTASVFFRKDEEKPAQDVHSPAPPQEKLPVQEKPAESLQRGTVIPRHQDTMVPSNHDIMVPQPHNSTTPRNRDTTVSQEDETLEAIRSAVKQLGKEAATHRFTVEEKQALLSIVFDYKNKHVRTSENEIARIAINFLLIDYRKNGNTSLLAKVLERLNK